MASRGLVGYTRDAARHAARSSTSGSSKRGRRWNGRSRNGRRGEKQRGEKGGALAVVEGQMVDKQTGEILPETAAEDFRGYAGVATVTLDQEQAKKLAA